MERHAQNRTAPHAQTIGPTSPASVDPAPSGQPPQCMHYVKNPHSSLELWTSKQASTMQVRGGVRSLGPALGAPHHPSPPTAPPPRAVQRGASIIKNPSHGTWQSASLPKTDRARCPSHGTWQSASLHRTDIGFDIPPSPMLPRSRHGKEDTDQAGNAHRQSRQAHDADPTTGHAHRGVVCISGRSQANKRW